MTKEETITAFNTSLSTFMDRDCYLLHRNIYERSITHKLAEYLQLNFLHFNVDCEYNGDIENIVNYRKQLDITEEEMIEIARQKIRDDETYSVYPDIIIHKRDTNDYNHLVIEVKKGNGNSKDKAFDLLKLKKFTTQYGYRLGIYLEFSTGEHATVVSLRYFQGGVEKNVENLNEL
jgi:hypothetical protein